MTVSDAGIDQASESDVVVDDWLIGLELVAFENIEGHFHVTKLPISLDEDAHLDRQVMVLLVLFLRVSLELCDLKLVLLVAHGRKFLLVSSLIVDLDSFVRQRVPHTKVHERVQNDDVQVLVEFVDEVPQVSPDLLQVHLGDLDLLRVLKVDELRVSKNF